MDEASSQRIADPANPGKSRRRRQLTVLIACILIATALWFLRAFENEYTTHVVQPVQFINISDELMPLTALPPKISLEVKGMGFSILRHNWNLSKNPVTIDISKLKSVSARKKKGFVEYLPMNQYLTVFSNQLKDLKVLAVNPDTLVFRFALKKKRMIIVKPAFESGSQAIPDSLVRINPERIEAEGPDMILDTLRSIRTLPIKLSRQGASFSRSLGLEPVHKLVITKPDKVTVSIGKKN